MALGLGLGWGFAGEGEVWLGGTLSSQENSSHPFFAIFMQTEIVKSGPMRGRLSCT